MIAYLQQISAKTGMTPQQFGSVNAGLDQLFSSMPNIFGGGTGGLSGQLDSLFASQPGIFGTDNSLSGQLDQLFASQPSIFGSGYAGAFGTSPSFGLGGLGTSLFNPMGTMPTMATQPLGSSDIFGGMNPTSMSGGSMMNMMGMGGLGNLLSPITNMLGMGGGTGAMAGTTGAVAGAGGAMAGAAPQAAGGLFGGMGGMGMGMGLSSMFMSMIPMMMGVGGGSPAGEAARTRAQSGSSSTDAALGSSEEGSDSTDAIEELKDETEDFKDLSDRLLTEIKDNLIEVKINAIEFQIEHMEKIDKNFQAWLMVFMAAHAQKLVYLQLIISGLQGIQMTLQTLAQSMQMCCSMKSGGMAKGGIVSGLIRGYAKGAITTGPELAMIGEGMKREAVVPLPDNRSIPVTFTNKDDEKEPVDNRPINITINGVEGTEKGLKRSAAQIAYQVERVRRNILVRY
jgi:hypothetical protein